jgi:TRAP-type C4-dicarboxylate transport system permease small subunit
MASGDEPGREGRPASAGQPDGGNAHRRAQHDEGWGVTMAQPAPRVSLIGTMAQACEYVSLVSLAVIAILIFAQILLRNMVSMAFAGIEELARFAHINLVFLLVPLLFREGRHVNIDLLTQHVGPRLKRVLYCLFFLVSEYQFMAKNGSVPSPGLGIPNIVFFAGAYLGMALLLLTAAEKLVQTVKSRPDGGGR